MFLGARKAMDKRRLPFLGIPVVPTRKGRLARNCATVVRLGHSIVDETSCGGVTWPFSYGLHWRFSLKSSFLLLRWPRKNPRFSSAHRAKLSAIAPYGLRARRVSSISKGW